MRHVPMILSAAAFLLAAAAFVYTLQMHPASPEPVAPVLRPAPAAPAAMSPAQLQQLVQQAVSQAIDDQVPSAAEPTPAASPEVDPFDRTEVQLNAEQAGRDVLDALVERGQYDAELRGEFQNALRDLHPDDGRALLAELSIVFNEGLAEPPPPGEPWF